MRAMRFIPRLLIAILSGVGGGAIGLAIAWQCELQYLNLENGFARDAYFFAAIFLPAFAVLVAVFRTLGGASPRDYPFDA